MKMLNVAAFAVLSLLTLNAFAAKTDAEVYQITATNIQDSVKASASAVGDCQIEFDEAKFSALLVSDNITAILTGGTGGGSPEGDGNYSKFFNGAASVPAGEAYMTLEEFYASKKADGARALALGLKLTIARNNCKSDALRGELLMFEGKDTNVISKTKFQVR